MKVRVMGLTDCRLCKTLREALDNSNVDHVFSDCEHDSENCDSLESITGTSIYPMVLILDSEQNLLDIAYIASHYEQLEGGTKTQNGIQLVANHSVDGLLKYTINKLNLNL